MKEEEREATGTKEQQLGFFIYIYFAFQHLVMKLFGFLFPAFFSSLSLTCSMSFSFVQLNIRHAEIITE